MLSNRGMQIIEKIIEKNRQPVTSKELALYLGVSERSVKTYIKEVADFCSTHNMKFESKPGRGFIADFTADEIEEIINLKKGIMTESTQNYRINYILFILFSGWDTYTLSLFAEELNVSKKAISDALDEISKKIKKYNITINRIAGKGISISGYEFDIRRALKEYCIYPIGKHEIEKSREIRLDVEIEKLCINNYGADNFLHAINIVKAIERELKTEYTDYSFKMLIHYLCISLARIRLGYVIDVPIDGYVERILSKKAIATIIKMTEDETGVLLTEYEIWYLDILFASAQLQYLSPEMEYFDCKKHKMYIIDDICSDMLIYLSEIFNTVDLLENDLLKTSLLSFVPYSFVRTKFGIGVINPFFEDVKKMYSGIFATSFTMSGFYEKYCEASATEQEISFLALYIGGAIRRNAKNIKAVLIGTGGIAAARIVARKIENKVEDIKIMAVLSTEKMDELDNLEFDIILSMLPDFEYANKTVYITPIVSENDVKNIQAACFEAVANPSVNKSRSILSALINKEFIIFIDIKTTKEGVLSRACNKLYEYGYVSDSFYEDVMSRENVSATVLGNGVAIPHGTAPNVFHPIICIIRLLHPVEWEEEKVDTIFLLALNFDNISITKVFFSDFARILGSDEKISLIRGTKNADELENVIKNDLHWG